MSMYPTEDILAYVVAELGGISAARGDSVTPVWSVRRARAGDEYHQELPSISSWIVGSDGSIDGSPVDEVVTVASQIVLRLEDCDGDPEGASNRAREDMLAALMRVGGAAEGLNQAELIGFESEFLWDIEDHERDIGAVVMFKFRVTRARDNFRLPNI